MAEEESDDDWDDDDDGFEDGDDGDWGEAIEYDGFSSVKATKPSDITEEDREEREEPTPWKCDECKYQNPGGLLCLGCGKPDLGALDREKRKQQLKECKFWSEIYVDIYLPLQMHIKSKGELMLDRSLVEKSVREIYSHEGLDLRWPDLKKWSDSDMKDSCDVCLSKFDVIDLAAEDIKDDSESLSLTIREELTCHCNICRNCFKSWIESQIKQGQIIPYIRCPAEECDCSIPYGNFVNHYHLSTKSLYEFCSIYCEKMLARNSNWISCPNGRCKFGVMFGMAEDEKEVTCDACDETHTLKRKEEQDEGFKKMVADGLIRFCPVCEHPHMKDYGLCNVLQCEECNTWWNWRTKDHAKTSRELKERARREKTLWEPGELEYQQKLQREDLPAFIALLARNGIKYDPSYRRGQ